MIEWENKKSNFCSDNVYTLLNLLPRDQGAVILVVLPEFMVCAHGNQAVFVQQQDAVRVPDGGVPVGYNKGGLFTHQFRQPV